MNTNLKSLYEQLLPGLNALEDERIKLAAKLGRLKNICLTVTVAAAIVLLSMGYLVIVIFVAALGITVYTLLYHRFKRAYADNYKDRVMVEMVKALGDGYHYDKSGKIEEQVIRESGLFHEFNIDKGEDLISGTFDKYSFEMAETNLWKETEARNNAERGGTLKYLFKGLFFVGKIPFSFPTRIWILSQRAPNIPNLQRVGKEWKRVAVFHKTFNAEYQVYSEDPETAKKILPEEILATIIEVKNEVADDKMYMELAFNGNQVYLSISDMGELFEPPIQTPVTDFDRFKSDFKYLAATASLLQKLGIVGSK